LRENPGVFVPEKRMFAMFGSFLKKMYTVSEKGNLLPLTGCLLVFVSLFLPVYSVHSQIRISVFETISLTVINGTDAGLIPFALLWGLIASLQFAVVCNEKAGFILAVSAVAFLCAAFFLSQITLSSIGIGSYFFIVGLILTGFAPLKI
jgi:hypothetical protein